MIWLVCEKCGKVFHRNRTVMYGNGAELCQACAERRSTRGMGPG